MLSWALSLACGVWALQAVLSAMLARKFSRRFNDRPRLSYDSYQPPAAVIVPFKGLEPALEANVRSLCHQRYPDYRLVLVVESASDPAHAVIERVLAEQGESRADLIVAGEAPADQGQKVHNQLAALAHLRARGYGETVYVFADSDAVLGSDWLDRIVGPLARPQVGVTTGYRWLIPQAEDERGRTRLWAHLASVMNGSAARFLAMERFAQAWGGSMAIRRDTAERGGLEAALHGSLTDDYAVTRMVRQLGLRVYFVPRCLVPSPVNFTLGELVNFAHRQYLITRVYVPGVYWGGVAMALMYVGGAAGTLASLALGLVNGTVGPGLAWAGLAIGTVAAADQVRVMYTKRVIAFSFGQGMLAQLRWTLLLDRVGGLFYMPLHLALMLRGACGRSMRWRGVRYRLYSPHRVRKG